MVKGSDFFILNLIQRILKGWSLSIIYFRDNLSGNVLKIQTVLSRGIYSLRKLIWQFKSGTEINGNLNDKSIDFVILSFDLQSTSVNPLYLCGLAGNAPLFTASTMSRRGIQNNW